MITLKNLRINENKLNEVLSYICEATDPNKISFYKKFIEEDASIKQKLALLQKEGIDDSYSLLKRIAEISNLKCRKCDGVNKTWERQKLTAECNAELAVNMLEIVFEHDIDDENLFNEWLDKYENNMNKINFYNEKWGKEVDIHSTGEHAGKTVAQLKKEIRNLRGKPGNKEKMGQLLFALRAKQNWKKSTGLKK